IFSGGVVYHAYQHARSDDSARELTLRKSIFPQAEHFSNKSGTPPHYTAYAVNSDSKLKEVIGAVFVTTDVTPEFSGYAGPVKLLAGVDTKGAIAGVEVISHNETPAYVTGLDKFIGKFRGKSINDPLRIGEDIDGISRATITSQAVARSLASGSRRVAADILGLPSPAAQTRRGPVNTVPLVVPTLLFGVAIIAVMKNDNRLRWAALSGGLIYFGLMESTMLSIVQFINLGLGKIPAFADHPLWYALVGLTFLSLFLVGNVYCGCLCPFAGLQELLYKLSAPLRRAKKTVDHRVLSRAHILKYVILFVLLTLCFRMGKADPANIEVFVLLFSRHATPLGWTFIGLMLVLSLFHYRFWCRYLCPLGAFTGLLARFSLYKIRLEKGCGGCEACAKLCPTDAIDIRAQLPVIHYEECVLCGKCLLKCPQGIMHLDKPLVNTGAGHDKE
ncbi:MAG: 4Fe-4S binding protein, partial [Candidatus Omnitrophica bacterium]|nr:4Fe-4S binding protein [Candidatus Omnitrophota bacterium]